MFLSNENRLPYVEVTYDGTTLACAVAKEKSANSQRAYKALTAIYSGMENEAPLHMEMSLKIHDIVIDIYRSSHFIYTCFFIDYPGFILSAVTRYESIQKSEADKILEQVQSFERQGDLCLENKQYTSAIAHYRAAISLIEKKIQAKNLDTNLYWNKINCVERIFISILTREVVALAPLSDKYKSLLNSLRVKVSLMLDLNIQIREICLTVQTEYIALLKAMVDDIMIEIGPPEKEFAILASGSLAKMTATPYSDVEIFYLISNDSCTKDIEYIETLSKLLACRLIELGETPPFAPEAQSLEPDEFFIRGLMLDPPQLFPFKAHIKTPKEMSHAIFMGILDASKDLANGLGIEFMNHCLIAGSKELEAEFDEHMNAIFHENHNLIFSKKLFSDLLRWEIHVQRNKNKDLFSIKHNFYRPLLTILDDLQLKFWLMSSKNPWMLIKDFEKEAVIDHQLALNLEELLNQITTLRLRKYLDSQQQHDNMTIDSDLAKKSKLFYIDEGELMQMLIEISTFHKIAKGYTEENRSETNCALFPTHLDCHLIAGEIQSKILKHEEAEENLIRALKADEKNIRATKSLGVLYFETGKQQAALQLFSILSRLSKNDLERAEAMYYLGRIYLDRNDNELAYHNFYEADGIYTDYYEEQDMRRSPSIIFLNYSKVRLNLEVSNSLTKIRERILSDENLFGKRHPSLSSDYFVLGVILKELGHDLESKSYIEKAIAIDLPIFGSEHPRLQKYYQFLLN